MSQPRAAKQGQKRTLIEQIEIKLPGSEQLVQLSKCRLTTLMF